MRMAALDRRRHTVRSKRALSTGVRGNCSAVLRCSYLSVIPFGRDRLGARPLGSAVFRQRLRLALVGMRSCSLLLLTALGAGALAGCQSAQSSPSSAVAIDSIVQRGTLRAVVVGSALPYLEKSGDGYQGLGVTVLEAIRAEIQEAYDPKEGRLKLEPIPVVSVSEGLEKLRSGQADIACGVVFNWEREKTFDYTIPFAQSGVRVLAPEGNNGTPEALAGQVVGVVQDSVAAQKLKALAPEASYKVFADPAAALAALQSGAIKILGGDTLWLRGNQEAVAPKSSLVPAIPYGKAGMGCLTAESSPKLRNFSNIAIGRLMQRYLDGDAATLKSINQWVGPGSAVNLPSELIANYYRMVLSTTAGFEKS